MRKPGTPPASGRLRILRLCTGLQHPVPGAHRGSLTEDRAAPPSDTRPVAPPLSWTSVLRPLGPPVTRHPFPSPQPSWPPGGPFRVVQCLSGTSHPLLTPTSLLHQTQLLPLCHHPSTAATSPGKSERLALLLEPLPHGPPVPTPGAPAVLPPLQTRLRLCGRLTPCPQGHDPEPMATFTRAGTVLATRCGLTGCWGVLCGWWAEDSSALSMAP